VGTLLPAGECVKRNLPGPEGGGCQAGQAGALAPAARVPNWAGEIVKEGFVGPRAGRVDRRAIERVG